MTVVKRKIYGAGSALMQAANKPPGRPRPLGDPISRPAQFVEEGKRMANPLPYTFMSSLRSKRPRSGSRYVKR